MLAKQKSEKTMAATMMACRCTAMGTFLHKHFLKHISRNIHTVSRGRTPISASWTKLSPTFLGNYATALLMRHQTICSNLAFNLCTSTNHAISDELINVETLLDTALQGQHPGNLNAAEVYKTIQRLEKAFYTSLSHFSWFQSNRHIGFIQLLMSDKIMTMPKPIWGHPMMDGLIKNVLQQCHNMSSHELCCSLQSLLYLGVIHSPYMEPIVHNLYLLCRERISTFGLEPLDVMTGLRSRMFQRDWTGMQKELDHFVEVLAEEERMNEWTPQKAHHLGSIVLNYATLPLSNFEQHVEKPMMTLLQLLQDQAYLEDPDNICLYLRLARKLILNVPGGQKHGRKLMSLASEACLKQIGRFGTDNIAVGCASLRQSRCFNNELMIAFCERGLSLLNEDCSLSDVSNLFYSISHHTPLDIKRQYESAIFQRLSGEVDSVILSNLADNLVTANIKNNDLLVLFQQHVAEQGDRLATYSTRFNKIVRLLIKKPFILPEHEAMFTKSVQSALNKEFKLSNLALFFLYLITSTNTALDEAIMKRILDSIPRLRSSEHHRIAHGINQMKPHQTSQLRRQIANIQAALYKQIMVSGSGEITSLDHLCQLTMDIVVYSQKRDPTLTTHFMEMFPRFTKDMNDVRLTKVLHVFHDMAYYLPEVYDDVVDFAIDNSDTIQVQKLVFLLSTLARVGYTPKRFDEFVTLMLRVYHQLADAGDLRNQLLLMRSLNVLQVYPDKELLDIFSIDYIEQIDQLIESRQVNKSWYERSMMYLNRNVVLECPQLDIPWFHAQYIEDNCKPVEVEKPGLMKWFRDDVQEVLIDTDVLQQSKNLRRHVHTPYGHLIQFECILNNRNEPVPPEDYIDSIIPSDWQRIAILTLTQSCYTYNSRRTLGQEQLRWRQLEILGYKVIEIPHFEWYSMGLSDYNAKVDFLSDKIFNS